MDRLDLLWGYYNDIYLCNMVEHSSKLQKGRKRVWSGKLEYNPASASTDKAHPLKFILLLGIFCTLKLVNRRGPVRFGKDPKKLLDVLDNLGYFKLDAIEQVLETRNDVDSSEASSNVKP